MRVWIFSMALFAGIALWGADMLIDAGTGSDQPVLVDAGSPDGGTVTSMEDGYPPPRP